MIPLILAAAIFACGPAEFSDQPCGPEVSVTTSRGWDSGSVAAAGAGMIRSWDRRVARNRRMMPPYRTHEQSTRDRELRMERDRVLRMIDRNPNSLGALGLSFEVRELSRQRGQMFP